MDELETASPGVSKWKATALPGRTAKPYAIRLLHAIRTDAKKVNGLRWSGVERLTNTAQLPKQGPSAKRSAIAKECEIWK